MVVTSYLDTSFLMKIYVREAESAEVAALISVRPDLMINSLSELELTSTCLRKLPYVNATRHIQEFHSDRARGMYQFVPVDDDVYVHAADLCRRYSNTLKLRSLDAIHLATAIVYGADELATFDGKLADAAQQAGLKVIPARS